jgi:multidrug efflux pump subunit AcrB
MSEVVAAAQKEIDNMELPAGFSIDLAGTYEDQQESFGDLSMLMILIILLVYVVMAAQFESLKYPFLIMLSIPFALSGIIIALVATGGTLNMMSMLGGIMLIGIVVKNGIVLIDYISLNRERGMSIRRAVINGGESRLRPVIMTTLTTILGMIPMAIFNISLGLLCGSLLDVKQVGGICGALLTNLSAWLSGVWFDLELVGGVFEKIANVLPFMHAAEMEKASFQGKFEVAAGHLINVGIYSIVITTFAVFCFLEQRKRR